MNAKRILLTIGLCVLLFQGTTYGVIGVDDNVPAQELIFPFICEGTTGATPGDPPVFGTLNTVWSYAETQGQDTIVYALARNSKGILLLDYNDHLTPHDVGGSDCFQIVQMMSPSTQNQLLMTIGGKSYFAGYLTVSKHSPDDGVQNLFGWVTLSDPKFGYAAANFKPYQAEGGADPTTFAEGMGAGPIYADQYYLRYFLLNDNPETYNWWVVLRGANFCAAGNPLCHSSTALNCIICDEDEHCVSMAIPVPNRLNIINVGNYIPGALFPSSAYPKAGFAYCGLIERGFNEIEAFTNTDFTAFMWSYQREQFMSQTSCNNPPKAVCKDVTVPTQPGLCTANSSTGNASIDGGSFDPDGDPITLAQNPPGPYPLGTTTVTLTVTDSYGASDSCTATVKVVDQEAPVISAVSASPNILWPPNHKMVPVAVTVKATDNCGPTPVCKIVSVMSNEPENGLGDGDTAPDWLITGDLKVNLRAERSGKGNGRVYTITTKCTDASNNSSTKAVIVSVPHNM